MYRRREGRNVRQMQKYGKNVRNEEKGRFFYWQEMFHRIIRSNFVFHFSHWGISLLSNA